MKTALFYTLIAIAAVAALTMMARTLSGLVDVSVSSVQKALR